MWYNNHKNRYVCISSNDFPSNIIFQRIVGNTTKTNSRHALVILSGALLAAPCGSWCLLVCSWTLVVASGLYWGSWALLGSPGHLGVPGCAPGRSTPAHWNLSVCSGSSWQSWLLLLAADGCWRLWVDPCGIWQASRTTTWYFYFSLWFVIVMWLVSR